MKKDRNKQIVRLGLLLVVAVVLGSFVIEESIPSEKAVYIFGIDISHYQGSLPLLSSLREFSQAVQELLQTCELKGGRLPPHPGY